MSDSTKACGATPRLETDQHAVDSFLRTLAPGLGAVVALSRDLTDLEAPASFSPVWS